jgi:Aspartate/tyrosine/aromatic aminotransferase
MRWTKLWNEELQWKAGTNFWRSENLVAPKNFVVLSDSNF